jgi:hypothetical protein
MLNITVKCDTYDCCSPTKGFAYLVKGGAKE